MTFDSFCSNLLRDNEVKIFTGTPIGAAVVVLGCLYLFTSLLIIYFIKLQEWKAQTGNDKAVKSIIFPVFVNVLWANALVNIFVGFAALTLDFHPYAGSSSLATNIIFACIWALQHCVVEGVAILLMQKGLGNNAAIRCFKNIALWGGFTLIIELGIAFAPDPYISYALNMIWSMLMLVFYLFLWLAPQRRLYRRPAVIYYARFWFFFRLLSIIATTLLMIDYTSSVGNCIYTLGTLFPFTILEPTVMYYTLLQDSRWWQGLDISQGQRTKSVEEIRSPLQGVEVDLKSAQTLAASLDKMGVSRSRTANSAVRLLNFAYISLDKNRMLGSGSFSKVYAGKYRNKPVAIKLIFTMDLTQDVIRRIAAEAQILSVIKHPNIVEIIGVSVLPPSVCILLELCYFGSLTDVIGSAGAFHLSAASNFMICFLTGDYMIGKQSTRGLSISWIDRLQMILGCAKGLNALHTYTKDLCHRDVKSFNFLVDDQLNAKISDLELGITEELLLSLTGKRNRNKPNKNNNNNNKKRPDSLDLSHPQKDTNTSARQRPLSITSSNNSGGSNNNKNDPDEAMKPCDLENLEQGVYAADEFLANWAAPEVIKDGVHSQKSDIYSFALVMWEMLSGVVPFHEERKQDDIRIAVLQGQRPEIPECFLSEQFFAGHYARYIALMRCAWSPQPSDRPTAQQLVDELESIYKAHCYDIIKETCAVDMELYSSPHPAAEEIPSSPLSYSHQHQSHHQQSHQHQSQQQQQQQHQQSQQHSTSSHQQSSKSLFSLFGSRKQLLPSSLTDEQIVNITNMLHEENNVLDQMMNSNEAWALVLPQVGHSILWASPLFSDCLDLEYEEVFGASLRNISAFNTILNQSNSNNNKPSSAQQEHMSQIDSFFHKLTTMQYQQVAHFVLELQVQELRNMTLHSSTLQSTTRDSFMGGLGGGLGGAGFRSSSVGVSSAFRQHKAMFSIHAYPIANKRMVMESMHIPIPTTSGGGSMTSEKETVSSTTSSNSLVNTLRQFSHSFQLSSSSSPSPMPMMVSSSSLTHSSLTNHHMMNNHTPTTSSHSNHRSSSKGMATAPVAIDKPAATTATATTTGGVDTGNGNGNTGNGTNGNTGTSGNGNTGIASSYTSGISMNLDMDIEHENENEKAVAAEEHDGIIPPDDTGMHDSLTRSSGGGNGNTGNGNGNTGNGTNGNGNTGNDSVSTQSASSAFISLLNKRPSAQSKVVSSSPSVAMVALLFTRIKDIPGGRSGITGNGNGISGNGIGGNGTTGNEDTGNQVNTLRWIMNSTATHRAKAARAQAPPRPASTTSIAMDTVV